MSFTSRAVMDAEREVERLARSAYADSASWARLKSCLLAASNELRIEAGQVQTPVDPMPVAGLRRVCAIVDSGHGGPPGGTLNATPGGFIVRLDGAPGSSRWRWALAHEIGHTFFYDLRVTPPARVIPPGTNKRRWYKEEDMCGVFARELLMPTELVSREFGRMARSSPLGVIVTLAGRFRVSTEVAAVRLLSDLGAFPTAAIIFVRSHDRDSQGRSPRVKVYRGRSLRTYTRKTEQELLKLVCRSVDDSGAFRGLDDIAVDHKEIAVVEQRRDGASRTPTVLLVFRRERPGNAPGHQASCNP